MPQDELVRPHTPEVSSGVCSVDMVKYVNVNLSQDSGDSYAHFLMLQLCASHTQWTVRVCGGPDAPRTVCDVPSRKKLDVAGQTRRNNLPPNNNTEPMARLAGLLFVQKCHERT